MSSSFSRSPAMLDKYVQRSSGSTPAAPSTAGSPSYNRDIQYEPGLEPPALLELLKAYYAEIGRPMPAVSTTPTQYAAAPAAKEKREEVGEFEGARNFVKDVKRAYEHRPEVYRSFLDSLHDYHQKHHDIPTVVESVRKLFVDRPDFVERFSRYLPASSAANDARPDQSGLYVSKSPNKKKQPQCVKKPAVTFNHALDYLEQVKSRCPPDDYTEFLDIMKNFKAQKADTKEVLRRITELFKDHADLREGFRVFLPPGHESDS